MKIEYIIWSDGVLTSIGELVDRNSDGTISVKNPANIVFSTQQKPDDEDPNKLVPKLCFDITPYLFGVCLNEDNCQNVWTCKPAHVLTKGEIADDIIDAYKHTVEITSRRPKQK